jgi:hypothetical protein
MWGYTFEVGSTSYDAMDVTLGLKYANSGSITPNMRIQVWELADLTSLSPAVGDSPYYTLNDNTKTFNSTIQYYTYSFNNGTLNLKANTRYSIGFSTDVLTGGSSFRWHALNPGNAPTGTAGLTSSGYVYSLDGGATYSAGPADMTQAFRLNGELAVGGSAAVPEPSSMAIFGIGALGMAYHVRRKSIARRESKA